MNINQTALYGYIGAAVKKHREARGLTQAQLGEAVGLLRTSIVNLEGGRQRMPLHTLYPICATLGIELTDVLPSIHEVLAEDQLVLRIDTDDRAVPARTAAFVTGLLEQEDDEAGN